MRFLDECPVFSSGRFLNRKGDVKAYVSDDKRVVYRAYDGKVAGYIRDGKLYDETQNYVGYFKDGTLYKVGGGIIGYCHEWKIEEKDVYKEHDSSFDWEILEWIASLATLAVAYFSMRGTFF